MNDDFVRRSDILELKRTLYRVRYGTGCQSIEDTEAVEVDDIESVPSANVYPVVRARWEWKNTDALASFAWTCSVCGQRKVFKTNFCPNCGADMREGVDE